MQKHNYVVCLRHQSAVPNSKSTGIYVYTLVICRSYSSIRLCTCIDNMQTLFYYRNHLFGHSYILPYFLQKSSSIRPCTCIESDNMHKHYFLSQKPSLFKVDSGKPLLLLSYIFVIFIVCIAILLAYMIIIIAYKNMYMYIHAGFEVGLCSRLSVCTFACM